MTNITLIGAGSVEFTRILLADMSEFPELSGTTITLHDIDEQRLDTAERLARYVNDQTGAQFQIRTHLDRRAALDHADYVVNEIQVGGFDATLRDFEIPKRYGLRQTIGDTIGVGGVFRGLRTIPVLVEIANDMAELCPAAILLNYANPMAMLPWSVWEGSPLANAIGLCHSVQNTHEQLAEMVGVPVERDRVLHRRSQPPSVRAPVRARRREPLPVARQGDRARSRWPRPAGCASSSIADCGSSPPSRASTAPSMCPGSCDTTTRSSTTGSPSTSTSAGRSRTSRNTSRRARAWPRARRSRSRERASSRRATSTRSSPASAGSSTGTSATMG